MKKTILTLILITGTMCVFTTCKKEPGEGGTSTIKGRVKAVEYDFTTFGSWVNKKEYYISEQRVYIIYGDNDIYDDDFRTGPDGYYQFKWLRKGEYTIFIYSVDTIETGLNFKNGIYDEIVYPVEVEVEITKNKKEVTAPEIVIVKCRNC